MTDERKRGGKGGKVSEVFTFDVIERLFYYTCDSLRALANQLSSASTKFGTTEQTTQLVEANQAHSLLITLN